MSFIHLHVHTNFSFGDGAGRIDELVQAALRLGMPALAITDHDGLYGAVRFYQAYGFQRLELPQYPGALWFTTTLDDEPRGPA